MAVIEQQLEYPYADMRPEYLWMAEQQGYALPAEYDDE